MRLRLIAVLLALGAGCASADYSQHAGVSRLLETLRDDYGFSVTELSGVRAALADAEPLPALINSELHNKETVYKPDWSRYRKIHVNDRNIANGLRFLDENRTWFARAETQFGVPPAVVAAVLGVETKYGSFTGKYRVLDALATQGFDHPTRSAFFFSELIQYFVFCRDAGVSPTVYKGSYAGAMGDAQFMPSNYRRLALDYDGDGRRDLWSPADAIGSIANYLTHYDPGRAWQRGQPLVVPATLSEPLPEGFPRNGRHADQTVAALRKLGVQPAVALPDDLPAGLIELQSGDRREYWIGLANFYAVQTYNPRVFYAMAVTELADALTTARDAVQTAAP